MPEGEPMPQSAEAAPTADNRAADNPMADAPAPATPVAGT